MTNETNSHLEVNRDADFLAHGIENAYCAAVPGDPHLHPVMECMCGFSTGRRASWAVAGREFDWHLTSVGVA